MKLDAAQQKRLLRLYERGEPVSELTSMFGISRSTLFRTLKVLKRRESASVRGELRRQWHHVSIFRYASGFGPTWF
jgi:DNA invertase Pin-like site-specific DNA recombinase